MQVSTHRGISGSTEQLWELYLEAFSSLRTRAVQRHLMTRDEFDELMRDERIITYVVHDGDVAAGMGTLTNSLDAIHLVSADYFAFHYPEKVTGKSLYYCSFVAVRPQYQATGTMRQVIAAMCDEVAPLGGTIVLDIPEYNEQALRLPTAILRAGHLSVPGVEVRRLDAQVYWAYDFPAPAQLDLTAVGPIDLTAEVSDDLTTGSSA